MPPRTMKKPGALFAIYTDSPSTSSKQPTNPSESTKSPIKKSTKSTTTLITKPRSALQPRFPPVIVDDQPVEGKGKAKEGEEIRESKTSTDPADKENIIKKPSVNPKPSSVVKGTIKSTTGHTIKKSISGKRQFEIFHPPSPTLPDTTFTSTTTTTVRTSTITSRSIQSPAKKTRSTPRKGVLQSEDKENTAAPSSSDSPASRTRSKTRNSISNAESPVRGMIEKNIGDGKGTLSLKEGRTLAKMLGRGEMAVLGDVSEAYGAEGVEPIGFKTQRR